MAKGSKRSKAKVRGSVTSDLAQVHQGGHRTLSSQYRTSETPRKPFSLADAARNTDRRHTWISATKLRNLPVEFISAGTENNQLIPRELAEESNVPRKENCGTHVRQADLTPLSSDVRVEYGSSYHTSVDRSGLFFFDSKGEQPACDKTKPPSTAALPSPTISESSEDIVVFAGRNGSRARSQAARNQCPSTVRRDSGRIWQPQVMCEAQSPTKSSGETAEDPGVQYDDLQISFSVRSEGSYERLVTSRHSSTHRNGLTRSVEDGASTDSARADYIANICEHESVNPINSEGEIEGPREPENETVEAPELRIDKSKVLISDMTFNMHETTTKDKRDQLSHNRFSETDSDASLDTIDQATRDLEEALAEVDVQSDFFSAGMAMITDEELARRLGKQEELGMNADTLMLLDGAEGSTDDEPDFEFLRREARRLAERPVKSTKSTTNTSKLRRPIPNSFTGPEEEIYGMFDIMDRERASIQAPSMLRRSIGLHDSDLDEVLQYSWQQDRRKKKIKKQEREALRAQGLLNSKGKVDLKIKYASGMTFETIKHEIKVFVESGAESVALPPMDKRNRKIVHDIANALKIKSKSIGSGHKRFPCLYRTSRTIEFDGDDAFEALVTHLSRRFIPRSDHFKARAGGSGIKSGSAAVSYRDGDIVGASAPKLGVENRGRAMLEKMGWCDGTALGAANNKGMLQPVIHVVKKSRAGLG